MPGVINVANKVVVKIAGEIRTESAPIPVLIIEEVREKQGRHTYCSKFMGEVCCPLIPQIANALVDDDAFHMDE
jgi:hypothetical protein